MGQLDKKVALITGASRGIGAALAVGLAKHGADIAICDLARQADGLADVKKQVEPKGAAALPTTWMCRTWLTWKAR